MCVRVCVFTYEVVLYQQNNATQDREVRANAKVSNVSSFPLTYSRTTGWVRARQRSLLTRDQVRLCAGGL